MTIYTFDYYWQQFHYITKQPKVCKELARHEWNKCIILDNKKKVIESIRFNKNTPLNGFKYLINNLNKY